MLHDVDGLAELEADVHWAGLDGLHEPWIADPESDVSLVGLRGGAVGTEERTEVETTHGEFRQMLLSSFTWRREHNDIVWLSNRGE